MLPAHFRFKKKKKKFQGHGATFTRRAIFFGPLQSRRPDDRTKSEHLSLPKTGRLRQSAAGRSGKKKNSAHPPDRTAIPSSRQAASRAKMTTFLLASDSKISFSTITAYWRHVIHSAYRVGSLSPALNSAGWPHSCT